jgi:RsiW-degrading membrane proteinase PrsW (M82 family)
VLLYFSLGLCALAAACLVYRYDMYDREPPGLLALAVGLGVGAMAAAGVLEEWTLSGERITREPAIAAVAALEEESLKLLVVAVIALLFRRDFNDPMDGLIYGSMSGLGMALEESSHLLRASHATGPLPPPAELVRLCGHLVMGGIGGFPLGLARVRHPRWPWALLGCVLAATGLHLGWDWLCLVAPASGELRPGQAVVGSLIMLAGMALYGALVDFASHRSRDLFAPGQPDRLWGWPFR